MAYSVSERYREQCYAGSSLYDCRLIIGENTIPISQIQSITISSPIIDDSQETFYVGTFISQKLTIQFKNLDGIDTTSGTNVELYISQYVDNAWVEVPIGKYIIDESPENYYQSSKIECLDYAIKFATNVDYSPAFDDGKIKIDDLLQWLCTYYGVTLGNYPNTNGNVEIGTYDSTISGKRWISYIAEIKGCNAKMDRLGQLTLVPLKSAAAVTIDALASKSWELGEKFEVSKVVYFDAIRNYTFGDDTENTLILRQDNPFVVDESVVRNVYEKLRLDNYTSEEGTNFTIQNTVANDPIQSLTLKGQTSQASTPTPSSPVPINVVTGRQEIDVCGKQFFQDEYIGIPSNNANDINAHLKAGTYTLASCDSNNFGKNIYIRLFDKDTKAIITTSGHVTATTGGSFVSWNFSSSSYSYYGGNGVSTLTLTFDDDYYLNIGLLNSDNTRQVMLVKGSETVRTYTPYTGITQEINLGVDNLFNQDTITSIGSDGGTYSDGVITTNQVSTNPSNFVVYFTSLSLPAKVANTVP